MYFDDEKHKPDAKVLGAWFLGSGESTNEKGKSYSFMEILVSSRDSADKFYEFYHSSKLQALGDSSVNQCK